MYELKKIPEDFIVEEVADREFTGGKYSVFILDKKNYNTEDAVSRLADYLKIQRKNICYAGAKDRNALTKQYISILGVQKKDFELKDIKINYVGDTNKPISLGSLKGNKFTITVRNLSNEKIVPINDFINYFDEQRFSHNNAEIGKAIITKKYAQACKIILEENSKTSIIIKEILDKKETAYISALKNIPRKTLLIFVHAYQSKIWNEVVEKLEKEKDKNKSKVEKNELNQLNVVPLPGFATELNNNIKEIYEEVLCREKITLRDFILRDFPEISLEGTSRDVRIQINDLKIGELIDDELNSGKKKVTISFFLKKGAYATMAIKNIVI